MFKCDNCYYTSNYKYNVNRHQVVHNAMPSITQNNQQTTLNHQSSNREIQRIDTPYPVQALNLANNVQIPPTTQQIINIQPPTNRLPIKKPVIHEDNQKFFDVRLKENFKLFISGPSRSGKTVFVQKLIENMDIFSRSPPKIITLVYKVFQPIYYDMNIDHLVLDGDNLKERLINIANGEPMLIIFDDLINSNSLSELSDMFVVDGRHMNFSMIFISQKLFVNNDHYRQISLNCDYYTLFKNPRNALEIRNLASQMTPGKMELVSYYTEATKQAFSYLFINLTQECEYQVKYLSHLFNEPHKVLCYFNSSTKQLIDGLNNGRTNFQKMYINSDSTYIHHSSNNVNNNQSDKGGNSTYHHISTRDVPIMGTHGTSTHSQSTISDEIDKRESSTSTHGNDQSTITHAVNKRNNSTITDFMNRKNVGTSTYIPMKDVSLSMNTPMKDVGISPDRGNKKDSGTSTFIPMKDVGISPDRENKKDSDTSTLIPMKDVSVSMNIPMYNQGVSTNIRDNDTTDISTNTSTEMVSNNDVSYDNRHSLYSYRDMTPNHTRPERQWRLDAPIYSLIRRPLYRNYNTYMDHESLTHDDSGGESALTYNVPNAITYENTMVPYHDHESLTHDDRGGESALTYDVPKAITYENTMVPYHDYNHYTDDVTCVQCEEVFHSTNALKRHQPSCKPSVYACNVCGKNLLTRNSLTRHIRAMHQNRRDIRSVEQKFT